MIFNFLNETFAKIRVDLISIVALQKSFSRYWRLLWNCDLDPYFRLQSLRERLCGEKMHVDIEKMDGLGF
jgi:hypothetical protein